MVRLANLLVYIKHRKYVLNPNRFVRSPIQKINLKLAITDMNKFKEKLKSINVLAALLLSLLIVTGCDSDSNIVSSDQGLSPVVMSEVTTGAGIGVLSTAYVCAQPANATASSTYLGFGANYTIDCDLETGWNSGGWDEASIKVEFDTPRVFSGLHITARANPAETKTYKIVGYRADDTVVTITEEFAIVDPSSTDNGATASKVFDLGEGFVEYTSVSVTILGKTKSWKSIREVELIISKEQCKAGGWEILGFENQGQCVRFVESGKDSR